MKSKRTIATSISKEAYQDVLERDQACIFCGKNYFLECMHFVPRSKGGLGIKENLAMGCRDCHHQLDHTTNRKELMKVFERHLERHYPGFTERTYHK